MTDFVIKEGVESVWRYHVAAPDDYTAPCGARVMNSNFTIDRWGEECANTMIHYKWCDKCKERLDGYLRFQRHRQR